MREKDEREKDERERDERKRSYGMDEERDSDRVREREKLGNG